MEPPMASGVWGGGPKNVWRVAFLMQETNKFTSFTSQAASRWLTCSGWLTWQKTRTYLLKHREKEKQARKLRYRQQKESAKDANIERCSGKQVQIVAHDYGREHHRRRLRKRKKVRHSMRTAAITRCWLHWRFPEDHPWFCGLGWPFFLLVSFFFFFSFDFAFFFLERDCLLCAICHTWRRACTSTNTSVLIIIINFYEPSSKLSLRQHAQRVWRDVKDFMSWNAKIPSALSVDFFHKSTCFIHTPLNRK